MMLNILKMRSSPLKTVVPGEHSLFLTVPFVESEFPVPVLVSLASHCSAGLRILQSNWFATSALS